MIEERMSFVNLLGKYKIPGLQQFFIYIFHVPSIVLHLLYYSTIL